MKRFAFAAMSAIAMISTAAFGSTIAVIDSGVDFLHKDLSSHTWSNKNEIARNGIDDDKNGYIDDVNGWNFAENNRLVIDYSYLNTFTGDVYRFFELQTKSLQGEASQAEKDWMKLKVQDASFVKELGKFGNFVHGTHVSGIASRFSSISSVLALKIIPTEVKGPFSKVASIGSGPINPIADLVIKAGISGLLSQQGKLFEKIGKYVENSVATVANCSFGTGWPQAQQVVGGILKVALGRNPSDEELEKYSKFFMERMIASSSKMAEASPNTLFVIAAGNDGLNNDIMPVSPANIKLQNTLSVAATNGFDKIASFSNFGEQMVDVAAPGVGISSSIPGNEELTLSGTSQAAPFVASVASSVQDENQNLHVNDVKEIILKTVDKKEWLVGKVKTAGIVNPQRALLAAKYSKSLPLYNAIEKANAEAADQQSTYGKHALDEQNIFVLPLPSTL